MPHILQLQKDKTLRNIIAQQDEHFIEKRNNLHLHLCASIISQQLNTRVADVIYSRFLQLFNKKIPSTKSILTIEFDKLRSIGLSHAKTNYVRNVCIFFIDNKLTDAKLHKMSDADLLDLLTQIKGVGRWTVEMLLMFTLGREDIFAIDDLVIQQTMAKAYGLNLTDKKLLKEQMIKVSDKWKPYRTYACKYLWGWRDTEGK